MSILDSFKSESHLDRDMITAVHDAYSAKAKGGTTEMYANTVAEAFGYTTEQLQSIPSEAHMGLSCGNPIATASLKEGEIVVDLGSGGGIDIFLATAKVGPNGQVIGLDMSADMIALARKNAQKQNLKPPQVSFIEAPLTEDLPLVSESIDCILSNCVINLLPLSGKVKIFQEAYRILKPGGRIALSDIIAKKELPDNIRNDLSLYVGCIGGAIEEEKYKMLLKNAGFKDILLVDTKSDLNIYGQANTGESEPKSQCCSSDNRSKAEQPTFDANLWAASYQIYAIKSGILQHGEESPSPLLRSWDVYPKVKSYPPLLIPDAVASLIRDPAKTSSDFVVIDVRRNDHGGGHVRGSHQWAAQTFYDTLPEFFNQFGETKEVIFYCGSSSGRGPRCAGWYQDYLNEKGIQSSTAYVLQGGIKAWLPKFSGQDDLIDWD